MAWRGKSPAYMHEERDMMMSETAVAGRALHKRSLAILGDRERNWRVYWRAFLGVVLIGSLSFSTISAAQMRSPMSGTGSNAPFNGSFSPDWSNPVPTLLKFRANKDGDCPKEVTSGIIDSGLADLLWQRLILVRRVVTGTLDFEISETKALDLKAPKDGAPQGDHGKINTENNADDSKPKDESVRRRLLHPRFFAF